MYDVVVAGCGFCGTVIARELAEKYDKKVLILEKRDHIAGNMYDEYDENGVLIQKYGPHTFVTDKEWVLDYVKQYASWHEYLVTAEAEIDGRLVSMPFGFRSIEQLYSPDEAKKLIAKLQTAFHGEERVPVFALIEHEDEDIRNFGKLLFEKDYIPYTSKQWGIPPEEIDKSVLARVKIALSYDTRYMQQKYQYMPDDSFAAVFQNMLDHPNIVVQLNADAIGKIRFEDSTGKVYLDDSNKAVPFIFTGPIDELFSLRYGHLPYRSLDIVFQTKDTDVYQKTAFIATPQADGYNRVTEYKHLTGQNVAGKTTLSFEYPLPYNPTSVNANIPYYPVINDGNVEAYQRYRELADQYQNLYVCGRLGDYKYYNMDAAIERALEVYRQILTDNGWR